MKLNCKIIWKFIYIKSKQFLKNLFEFVLFSGII